MKHLWITCVLPAALWLGCARGYDGYSACPKAYRSARQRTQLPCDFQQQSWCTIPGSAYPWHAVRRFVHENHGLMRRMYGDERHISVLRAEIESNDVELVRDSGWHLEDDVKRRYSAKPHFRPANRNHQQQQPSPPPPPATPEPLTTTTSGASVSSSAPTTITSPASQPTTVTMSPTAPPSTSTPSTTTSTTSTSPVTVTTPATTAPSTSTSGTPPSSTSEAPVDDEEPLSEPLGLYNGRIHPHIFNASNFASTSSRPPPPSTSSTTTPATSTTSTPASDTTAEDWATDETSHTTLPPAASPSTPSSTTATNTEDDELADVEDNVADEPDGGAAGAAGAAQETLFQDADSGPGPDAAQQPGKPATPLIKLRGINACPVKEEVVAPFWANNTRGEVLALLNLYPFEQYVHWEKCTHEHKQMFCREGCRCEQQYRLHRLLAYDPNNECRGIFSDWFKFPSCCICRCYDLPAEFRFTSRSPRTPALRGPGQAAFPQQRRPRPRQPGPHDAAPAKDWYRLQAGSGG